MFTKFKFFGKDYSLKLVRGNYRSNGNLAIIATSRGEDFCDVTVNLGMPLDHDVAFVDEPNCSGLTKWLVENKIATPLGKTRSSGFNTYHLYRFDLSLMKEM